ncbi:hypothetical protein CSA56_05745 [candidate division KSB3 bacterium]|uniref:Uncharacterized protein n=1 Tax=candidate division KSB3 bacterium TaxID=2044937 RepID=A0A2G6KJR5_9BACT|nr:MAG: hypothetical protein CSA56_05745 [candidate division KSB3 bacterium]
MHGRHRFHKSSTSISIIFVIVAALLFLVLLKDSSKENVAPSQPEQKQEGLDRKSYELGYSAGYKTAKEENEQAYERGYAAAKEEIGSGALTRFGMLGFWVGLCLSAGTFAAMKRRELSVWFQDIRKRYELKKAFKTIPPNLSPEVNEIAQQIAQAYTNTLHQLRTGQGYVVEQFAKQWRGKLRLLMSKALHLLKLIQGLESARANVDEKELARTIRGLKRTIQNPSSHDTARNAAVKSLQQAKQTQQDLLDTQKNLEHCTTSLQGIVRTLESMHLKISNLKVNAQSTGVLDELSSDLEVEMQALEETLNGLG